MGWGGRNVSFNGINKYKEGNGGWGEGQNLTLEKEEKASNSKHPRGRMWKPEYPGEKTTTLVGCRENPVDISSTAIKAQGGKRRRKKIIYIYIFIVKQTKKQERVTKKAIYITPLIWFDGFDFGVKVPLYSQLTANDSCTFLWLLIQCLSLCPHVLIWNTSWVPTH